MPVSTTRQDYDKKAKAWCKMRDVIAGCDAIQNAGEKYLPKLSGQDKTEYDAYLKRGVFFNATGRVVDALSGMVFRKEPDVKVPAGLKPIVEDITLNGVPLNQFSEQIVEELLSTTRSGVLVDFPTVTPEEGKVLTVDVAEKNGLRVYARLYKAETIINWRTTQVGGKTILSLVVLKEENEIVDVADKFSVKCVCVYRVLELVNGVYTQTVYENYDDKKPTEGEQIIPKMNGKPLAYIPFVFFGAQGNTPDIDEPVLYDLAVLNLAHYRNTADMEHGLHYTGLPTAVISGVSDKDATFFIGSGKAWVFGDPQAKAEFLEFKGEGLGSLNTAIERKEAQMAALGANMLAPEKKAAETTDTITNKRQGETSMLASIANATSRGITRVLQIMAEWSKVSGEIGFKLNTEYNVNQLSAQEITALIQAVMTGNISKETLFDTLVKGDAIATTRTFEEEQTLIDNQPIPAPAAPANDNGKKSAAA
ncbi:DUF4055 domain-containing protein [Frankia sp. RB7]|nr:DUF4055 domain-containing protein [Frankia sp. RB7]